MSALSNPTVWALAGAMLAVVFAGRRPASDVLVAYASWWRQPAVITLVAAVVAAHLGARVVLGIVAPGDFAGEVIAARSWSDGRTLYAPDLAAATRDLNSSPPDRLAGWVMARLPASSRALVEARRHARIAAQAHPPTLLGAFVPLIAVLGASGAFVVLAVSTVLAAAWAATRVPTALGLHPSFAALGLLLALGWQPVLAAVRDGQVTILVSALSLAAWLAVRRGRRTAAGTALGLATSMKVYPALLLVPLLGRSRHAAATALGASLLVLALTTAVVGPAAWAGYFDAATRVSLGHARTLASLSLLAWFGQFLARPVAIGCWVVASVLALVVTLVIGRRGLSSADTTDMSFAQFCCLAVVLPPVAWHHYSFVLLLPLLVAGRMVLQRGRRGGLLAWLAAALMLSLPVTDTTGIGTGGLPGMLPGLIVCPTVAILALWARLVWLPAAGAPATV